MQKVIHCGTIKGNARLALGHRQHITGTGAHRNIKSDKKVRRNEDRRACRGE